MSRRWHLVAAALFLVVGVWAAVNTWRFNRYVETTLRRDTAQEQCQLQTLQALRIWAKARLDVQLAEQDRDRIQDLVLRDLELGHTPGTEAALALNNAYDRLQAVREAAYGQMQSHPLPICDLGAR